MNRPLNILLVDDDDIEVENVQRAFKRAGIPHPLFIACDGVQALEMLRRNEVPSERRVVLLDLNMPRMTGLEMLRELRADPALQQTPVVIFSTSNHASDVEVAYRLNAAGYLVKPANFEHLVNALSALTRMWELVELP
jgi:CheY-like chemotaxis protein